MPRTWQVGGTPQLETTDPADANDYALPSGVHLLHFTVPFDAADIETDGHDLVTLAEGTIVLDVVIASSAEWAGILTGMFAVHLGTAGDVVSGLRLARVSVAETGPSPFDVLGHLDDSGAEMPYGRSRTPIAGGTAVVLGVGLSGLDASPTGGAVELYVLVADPE